VTLAIEVDPELIAGIRARLGDSIIDYSLQNRLSDLRNDLQADLRQRLHV
jgi:F0F1-type ATP synthase delta subunit